MKPISVYIHIPFCVKKCKYCDFLSAPADKPVQEAYLRALKAEIESQSGKYTDYTVQTVFFGGGTPTAVEAAILCEVLQTLKKYFNIAADAEVSMEANPGTVTAEALVQYKKAGINRLSIGLQSANDEELKLLGRIHTYADFLETYRLAVEIGFTNINVDLMSALPGQTVQGYEQTLQKILALEPPPRHISAYSLIIEEGTPFYEIYGAEREENPYLPTEEEDRLMYENTVQILSQAGYERYEISNYSQPGYECRHNTVYWRRGDYVGFGLGAASLVNNVRFRNTDNLQEYLRGSEYATEQEILSVEEQMEEFMFLGLRMTNGISKEEFRKTFGVSVEDIFGEIIRKNIKEELLQQKADRIALTKRGLDVSNYVMAQFIL
ncbi:MAG: oxygen-independent coproporphyrinogen III oxidase [Lachnospiraceae bacterium]|nr:oxygen-independent coproporphyrinogen III oxidase [Lachnospiraceae bacterium]